MRSPDICRAIGVCSLRAMLLAAMLLVSPTARAVNIVLDFDYDTSRFFGDGNPSGANAGMQARAALQAAASFYSGILNDTFSAIQTPQNFESDQFNGVAFFEWSLNFNHPSSTGLVTLQNETIAANEYRIYAGARNIDVLGVGGSGGYEVPAPTLNGGNFTQAEINQINNIQTAFIDDVARREEANGFARWGGFITFDRALDPGTTWHYNHTTLPPAGGNDFFSVAIHEMGHALGLGASSEWNAFVAVGATPDKRIFTGSNATAEFGSNPPLTSPSGSHWQSGVMSRIYGTNTPQEAAMDPEITVGTRKRFTQLDAAAAVDIGWEINLAPPQNFNLADFNEDTFVNGADLTQWRNAFRLTANGDADGDNDTDGNDFLIWQRQVGATSVLAAASAVPEPRAAALILPAVLAMASRRRNRRR